MQPQISERYLPEKDSQACGLFGVMNTAGERFGGEMAINAMVNMKVRGNGLGGGFAIYGLYPEYKDYYALHIMFERHQLGAKEIVDEFLADHFHVVYDEEIPTNKKATVLNPPVVWRYFVSPRQHLEEGNNLSDDEFVVEKVMYINTRIDGVYVFSSGKDMGVFKGVGFPRRLPITLCLTGCTRDTSGPPTVVFPPIRPDGGAGHTLFPSWTGRWCITVRFLLTAPTGVIWKCLAITVPFIRIRK